MNPNPDRDLVLETASADVTEVAVVALTPSDITDAFDPTYEARRLKHERKMRRKAAKASSPRGERSGKSMRPRTAMCKAVPPDERIRLVTYDEKGLETGHRVVSKAAWEKFQAEHPDRVRGGAK